MASVGFIKNTEGNIMPITRGELVLDSSGNMALHSQSFVATDIHPGLLSASDKKKLDGLVSKNYSIEGLNLPSVYVIKLLNDADNTYTDVVIPPMQGPTTNESGKAGLVPIPTPTDINKFLKSDGTWDSPIGIPTKLFIGEAGKLNNQESNSTYLKVFSGNTLLNQYNITGAGLASVSNDAQGNITINVPNIHQHATSHIASLQGYTKGENITNLASTDTLNQALSKLECKTDLGIIAYNWYQGVTGSDNDDIINKWGEIVSFVSGVTDDSTLLNLFVNTHMDQTINGIKTFSKSAYFDSSVYVKDMLIFSQESSDSVIPKAQLYTEFNRLYIKCFDNSGNRTISDQIAFLGDLKNISIPTNISSFVNDVGYVSVAGPSDTYGSSITFYGCKNNKLYPMNIECVSGDFWFRGGGKLSLFTSNNKASLDISVDGSNVYYEHTNQGAHVFNTICVYSLFAPDDSDLEVRSDLLTRNILPSRSGRCHLGTPDSYWNGVHSYYMDAEEYLSSSDETLKDFKQDITVDLEKLKQLPKKYFTWRPGHRDTTTVHIGTSAQKLQKLFPEIVTENTLGILQVDYSKLSVVALAAIDALYERILDLENKITYLENAKV